MATESTACCPPLSEAPKTNYLDWKRCYDPENFVPRLVADTMYFNTT